MAERPWLQIVHTSAGRLRLRAARAMDESFLGELARKLTESPAVHEVRTSARTGSVLILYDGERDALLEFLRELELFELATPKQRTPMHRIKRAIEEADERLAHRTHGAVTVGSITFAAMTVAGLWQSARGEMLPSGIALLQYALQALEREAEREIADSRSRS